MFWVSWSCDLNVWPPPPRYTCINLLSAGRSFSKNKENLFFPFHIHAKWYYANIFYRYKVIEMFIDYAHVNKPVKEIWQKTQGNCYTGCVHSQRLRGIDFVTKRAHLRTHAVICTYTHKRSDLWEVDTICHIVSEPWPELSGAWIIYDWKIN